MCKKIIFGVILTLTFSVVGCGNSQESIEEDKKETVEVTEEEIATSNIVKTTETVTEESTEVKEEKESDNQNEEVEIQKAIVTEAPEPNDLDGKIGLEDFRIIINNCEVKLGTDINEIKEYIGEPDVYSSARSCIDDGEEKQYVYGGYTIYTYPDGSKDIIYLVEFSTDAVTDANIGIGSKRNDVEMAYGTEYTEMNQYTIYEVNENASISIQYENDTVSYLDMYYR